MSQYEPYKYAEEILKTVGFKGVADYSTMISCDEITSDTLDAINSKMDQFKLLFKLREFNLARYGYKLTNSNQTITFVRKVLSQLDINHEIRRYQGKNHMRLKSPNKILSAFIMQNQNVATGSQNVSLGKNDLHQKTMSKVMDESLSKTAIKVETIYFYNWTSVLADHALDVITKLESSSPFSLRISGYNIAESEGVLELNLPLCFLHYSDATVFSKSQNSLVKLTITSYGLNKLRFQPDKYTIILDDSVCNSMYAVHSGSLNLLPKYPPVPCSECILESISTDIMGRSYNVGYGCAKAQNCLAVQRELDGCLKTVTTYIPMDYASINPDGTYNAYYSNYYNETQKNSIMHNVSGLQPHIKAYYVLGPYKTQILNNEIINFPLIVARRGVAVSGGGLCPDVQRVTRHFVLLENIPSDKLLDYRILTLDIGFIYMNPGSHELLESDNIKDWFIKRNSLKQSHLISHNESF
jgi:hypothetical protein